MLSTTQPPIFLKLGGSLITDKASPQTPRVDLLQDLVQKISEAWRLPPGMRLVLGHGSGSFGHFPAKKYGTREGVSTADQWLGFAEVWYQASALNRIVVDACHQSGLPAISFPPSATAITKGGNVAAWDLRPLQAALEAGLLPVVFGDVVLDTMIGGTILSTEDIFVYLADHLRPTRILLAGEETGVWNKFPAPSGLLHELTTADLMKDLPSIQGAVGTDVTGGMATKVRQMLELIETLPELSVQIFSGKDAALVKDALMGGTPGTTLRAAKYTS